jgi:hypothetical protein
MCKVRQLNCQVCGKDFESRHKAAKSCSKECRRIIINKNYRERYAQWPQRSMSKTMLARRERAERRWKLLFSKLGNRCAKCGNTYPKVVYDLHHPNGKNGRKDSPALILAQGSEETFLQHMQDWQILCANCHRLHHHETDWAPKWRQHELQANL